jgi:hypothetical protein
VSERDAAPSDAGGRPDPESAASPTVPTHVGTGSGTIDGEFDPPADADVAECGYCGRPFAGEELLALHRGHAHSDRLTGKERAAFEEAYETETGEMRRFQLKAAGAVILLYFLLLIVYAVV